MSNEIELYSKLQNPIEAIDRIGEMFARSGMFGCDKVEQGKVLAMACIAERKSPIQLNREYHIIEGRLSDRADSMLAKFRSKGGKHRVVTRTADEAAVELEIDGQKQVFKLTFAQACEEPFVWSNKTDAAGKRILKKNWATPRARMQTLWARVISDGVRTLAPEIVAGVYTPEEIEEIVEVVAPTAPLLKEKPAKAEKAEPEKTATIIDVQATATTATTPEPTPAKESPAATSTPAPATPPPPPAEPKKFTVEDVQAKPDGRLTNETVLALQAAIGDSNAQAALDWLIAHKWIKTTLDELTADRAKRIIAKPETFLGYVKGGGK